MHLAGREGAAACGLAENMLVDDSVTMAFSLPMTKESVGERQRQTTDDQHNEPSSREAY